MEFTIKEDSPTQLSVDTTFKKEQVDEVVAVYYSYLGKSKTIPKYRKGAAPVDVLKLHYPFSLIKDDIKRELANFALLNFKSQYKDKYKILDHTVTPKTLDVDEGSDAHISFTLEMYRRKELDVSLELPDVNNSDVEMYISKVRESYSRLHDIDSKDKIKDGDYCFLNFSNKNYSEVITYRYKQDTLLTNLDAFITSNSVNKIIEDVQSLKPIETGKITVKLSEKLKRLIENGEYRLEIVNIQRKTLPSNEEFLQTIGVNGGYEQYKEHVRELFKQNEVERQFFNILFNELIRAGKDTPIPKTLVEIRKDIVKSVTTHLVDSYKDVLDRDDFVCMTEYMRPFLFGYSTSTEDLIKILKENRLKKSTLDKFVQESSLLYAIINSCNTSDDKKISDLYSSELQEQMKSVNVSYPEWQSYINLKRKDKATREFIDDILNQIGYMLDVDIVVVQMLSKMPVKNGCDLVAIYRKKAAVAKKVLRMFDQQS